MNTAQSNRLPSMFTKWLFVATLASSAPASAGLDKEHPLGVVLSVGTAAVSGPPALTAFLPRTDHPTLNGFAAQTVNQPPLTPLPPWTANPWPHVLSGNIAADQDKSDDFSLADLRTAEIFSTIPLPIFIWLFLSTVLVVLSIGKYRPSTHRF